MLRTIISGTVSAFMLICGVLISASSLTAEEKLKIGYVLAGPVSDFGWNYSLEQGRLALENKLSDKVETKVLENIPETADFLRVVDRLVSDGTDVIFATAYGYADMSQKAAEKYPDVTFLVSFAPTKTGANISTYAANLYESAYVAGVVAALSVPDGKRFGSVVPHPFPVFYTFANAFTLGAQSVNPDVTLEMVYTNSWSDPAAESAAVESMAAQGFDLVYLLPDSNVAGALTAEKVGIPVIGTNTDLVSFAPTQWITGAEYRWGKANADIIEQVLEHNWTPKLLTGGFSEGYVGLSSFGPKVSDEARAKAAETIEAIAHGDLKLFQGPIYDAHGELRVPEGKALSDQEILEVEWVVKGIKGGPA